VPNSKLKSVNGLDRLRDTRPRLIVVEDDPVTRTMICTYFSTEGFDVEGAGTAEECWAALRQRKADLVFVDIHLPDGNGLVLAQEIRRESTAGLIFVTQRDSEIDRVVGLESAGDDYVTKPINLRELLARARALLRRRAIDQAELSRPSILTFGGWVLDLTRRELMTRAGDPIALTRGEFDLLAALAEANGRPLSREYLVEVVSNRRVDGDPRTVDSLVARLRRKLPATPGTPPVIVTVTGVGYRLGVSIDPR
jgi:two-component system torCAD operon response regulator TorR